MKAYQIILFTLFLIPMISWFVLVLSVRDHVCAGDECREDRFNQQFTALY